MDIFKEIQDRAINYQEVIDSCECNFAQSDCKGTDISVIVPVCGRTEFNYVLCKHFLEAIKYTHSLNIILTIVEHSDNPQHRKLCHHWVNHIWIPKNGQPFNKCLAHNIGALLTKEAAWFMFHDVDILVPEDFFPKLLLNMRGYDALQTFTKRRLMHCDQWLTDELIHGTVTMKEIDTFTGHYHPAQPGAMGGSIAIKKDLFFNTTFLAEAFNDYGLEDAFFWQCIDLMGRLGACDAPPVECYHLEHAANRNTKPIDWLVYNTFMDLSTEEKKQFIKLMADNLNQYRHDTKEIID